MLVERTQELKVEKNKSDKLLRQMLPVSVIQQLKQQRQVFIKLADSFNGLANLVQFLINVIWFLNEIKDKWQFVYDSHVNYRKLSTQRRLPKY